MRICYLADGRYVHSHRFLRYFSGQGDELTFLSFAPMEPPHVAAVEAAGARYLGELGPFHLKRFWRTAADLRRLRAILRRERVDILHCHFLGVNAWYAALSNFHPLVITVMGGDVCGPGWRPQGRREQLMTPFALRRADLITCWSHQLIAGVRPFCPPETPLAVIHGGIDLQRFHPGPRPRYLLDRWRIPEDARVVFSPRLMRPLYNLDKVAEAAGLVAGRRDDVYFIFAYQPVSTDEAYEKRVHEIIDRSPAAPRVRFVGAIPHEEMADYYRLAHVMVSIPRTDGTPMSVLEAMACGTPAIVGDIPDYDQQYLESEKTVLSVPVNHPASVADAILRLLDDHALARRLTAEALLRVKSSGGYETQMARMGQLYEKLA